MERGQGREPITVEDRDRGLRGMGEGREREREGGGELGWEGLMRRHGASEGVTSGLFT